MTLKRFQNISELFGTNNNDVRRGAGMAKLPSIQNAFLDVEGQLITGFGPMSDLAGESFGGEVIDMGNKPILPMFVDCHTHLVFAESREREFEDRLKGLSYQEIAERGGGILNSATKLAQKSEEDLFQSAMNRLDEVIRMGTGAIEIKSGYGLSPEAEIKMLRVIRRIKETAPIPVRATFLGAHAIPARFKNQPKKYLDEVLNEMLPEIAKEGLADFVDVFCEKGYFELDETNRILEAANRYDIPSRIHVNQFHSIGGIELAAQMNVKSVEHLEVLTDRDIECLTQSSMFAVALPGCSFFLKIPYTPVRQLIDANIPMAIASDYNPGSSPTGNLGFAWSLACLYMNMLPSEAFNALTINAAHALDLEREVGSFKVGKRANFMVLPKSMTLASIPYHVARTVIEEVWINGVRFS